MPRVSVIMNCHNSSKYLREALDSVFQQTFKDYEVVFWDNLSTDGSGEIALSYGAPVRYFRGEEFLPLGAARNAAVEKAQGEYIAFLDCDDIWLPEKLEKQAGLLDSKRELGLVYSDCYMIDGYGDTLGKTFFTTVRPFRGNAFDKLFQMNFAPMPTVMVTRKALGEVGVFNPKYQVAEEYDLWLRIADRYPIDFIETPLAKYRIGCGFASKNQEMAIDEALQIVQYWLEKKGTSVKGFPGKAKQRQASVRTSLMLHYFESHEGHKAIRQSLDLIRLLPHSLASVPTVMAWLLRLLKPGRNVHG